MKNIRTLVTCLFLTASLPALGGAPNDAAFIDGMQSDSAVILAHGKGKHPTWLVVDPLRIGINHKLGYHTLSLQMPTGYSDWREYADGFPEAFDTFRDAINFLRDEKGVKRIFLAGHSMGSRMASAFVAQAPNHGLSGLIVLGCRNNGGQPLACDANLENVTLPVLDIWGGNSDKDANAALEREHFTSANYQQTEISGANHKFENHEDELVQAVTSWLKTQ